MTKERIIAAIQGKNKAYEGLDLALRMRYYYQKGFSLAWSYQGERGTFCLGPRRKDDSLIEEDTLLQAGSISKTVFATLLMRLHDQGKIDLLEDVNSYLKDYHVEAPQAEKITLKMLLSHMAGFNVHGFRGYSPSQHMTNDDVIQGCGNSLKLLIDFPPQTCWRYSGGGYQIAQKAIEDSLGSDTQSLAEQYVFKPLGLTNSGYWQPLYETRHAQAAHAMNSPDENYHFYPELAAAGLWTTPSDLVDFALSLRNSLQGSDFLSQKTMAIMTDQVWNGRCVGIFCTEDQTEFFHGGSNMGFESLVAFSRDQDFAFAIMANSNGASALNREIFSVVKNELGISVS